jgi:hypothetical protein
VSSKGNSRKNGFFSLYTCVAGREGVLRLASVWDEEEERGQEGNECPVRETIGRMI